MLKTPLRAGHGASPVPAEPFDVDRRLHSMDRLRTIEHLLQFGTECRIGAVVDQVNRAKWRHIIDNAIVGRLCACGQIEADLNRTRDADGLVPAALYQIARRGQRRRSGRSRWFAVA